MNVSSGYLFSSMFVSTIGFGIFVYGKKQAHSAALIAGMLLMVEPYFLESVTPMLLVAGLLLGGLWIVARAGA